MLPGTLCRRVLQELLLHVIKSKKLLCKIYITGSINYTTRSLNSTPEGLHSQTTMSFATPRDFDGPPEMVVVGAAAPKAKKRIGPPSTAAGFRSSPRGAALRSISPPPVDLSVEGHRSSSSPRSCAAGGAPPVPSEFTGVASQILREEGGWQAITEDITKDLTNLRVELRGLAGEQRRGAADESKKVVAE